MPELATALQPNVMGLRRALSPRFTRRTVPRLLLYVLLLIGGLAMLFPFAWMVSTSLKPDLAVFQTPPQLIPKPFQPSNYSTVVHIFPVWRFLINSVVVAVISTTLQVGTSAMAAYAFARMKFRGSGVLFMLYLTTLMVPFQVTIVPLFVEMKYLHFVNSYPGPDRSVDRLGVRDVPAAAGVPEPPGGARGGGLRRRRQPLDRVHAHRAAARAPGARDVRGALVHRAAGTASCGRS